MSGTESKVGDAVKEGLLDGAEALGEKITHEAAKSASKHADTILAEIPPYDLVQDASL